MAAQNHPSGKVLQTAARVALLGLVINVGLATAKIVAGFIGHAYVLIADGIESALDVGGSIVIWGGLTVAALPPDETHPYGHGKAEPIAAMVVALGVLAAASCACSVDAGSSRRRGGRQGDIISLCNPIWSQGGKHRGKNRRLASSH